MLVAFYNLENDPDDDFYSTDWPQAPVKGAKVRIVNSRLDNAELKDFLVVEVTLSDCHKSCSADVDVVEIKTRG